MPTLEEVAAQKDEMLSVSEEHGVRSALFKKAYNYHIQLKQAYQSRVYFVQVCFPDGTRGPIKIGCSKNVEIRVGCLQSCNPYELRVLGTIQGYRDIEQEWHDRFSASHLRGEWYAPTDELLEAIKEVTR